MVGSTRGHDDELIVEQLKDQVKRYNLESSVIFMINKEKSEIIDLFSRAKVGIHTMKEEHFGITIVEMMASGLITIAHDSAGPKMDIIGSAKESVGYLARDLHSYVTSLVTAMKNYDSDWH